MNNEIKLKEIFSKYDQSPSICDFSLIDDCSININSSRKNQIVFYKNHNDEKSVSLFESRLEKVSPGLIVLTNKPKNKIEHPFVVVGESDFLEVQKKTLEVLFPVNKFPQILAITGTNGKTTTAFLLMQLLNQKNKMAGFVGTTGVYVNDKKIDHSFTTTSPGLIDFWKINYQNQELGYLCIEASSHALDQKRFYGFKFSNVAFTNITRDHLDYHENFENYFEAKRKILSYLDEHGRCFVIDTEEEIFNKLNDKRAALVSKIEPDSTQPFFSVDFNQKNLGVAVALAKSVLGEEVSFDYSLLAPPNGRLDITSFGDSNLGIVDFAHTPDAVENVLSEVKKGFPDHVIKVVFGCGGNRDKKKREEMGEIVSALSSNFVITNDNPRDEDPESIVQDILPGVIKGADYQIELDRKKAIEDSISSMNKREILLILGKGHEDYQLVKGVKTYFSDKEVLLSAIKNKNEN